jgi:hypothetical protein
MGALQILQQGRNRQVCMSNDALPIFYMSDYSVLGLLVANLDQAHRALAGFKFAVTNRSDYLEVSIDRADQMYEIANLLNRNGIDCGVADIIDQVYQG